MLSCDVLHVSTVERGAAVDLCMVAARPRLLFSRGSAAGPLPPPRPFSAAPLLLPGSASLLCTSSLEEKTCLSHFLLFFLAAVGSGL